MPKAARYHLSWVDEHGIYAMRSAHNNEHTLPDLVGSPEWFSWLSSIPSFTFTVNACILLRRNNFDPPDRIACPSYS